MWLCAFYGSFHILQSIYGVTTATMSPIQTLNQSFASIGNQKSPITSELKLSWMRQTHTCQIQPRTIAAPISHVLVWKQIKPPIPWPPACPLPLDIQSVRGYSWLNRHSDQWEGWGSGETNMGSLTYISHRRDPSNPLIWPEKQS